MYVSIFIQNELLIMITNIQDKYNEFLVCGYLKDNFDRYAPNIVSHTIWLFCKDIKCIPICVINSKGKNLSKRENNIVSINVNRESLLCITNNKELFIYQNFDFTKHFHIGYDNVNEITKASFFDRDNQGLVKLTSNGICNKHYWAYTMDNKLYKMEGVTSLRSSNRCSEFHELINHNFDSNLIQIECGDRYSMFLTQQGFVHISGVDTLMTVNKQRNDITKIDILKNIIKIGCARYTSYALKRDGSLYTFGSNKYGEFGIESRDNRENVLLGYNFKDMSVGVRNCGCINNSNELYMWG